MLTMKLLHIITTAILITVCSSAPTTSSANSPNFGKEEELVIYTAEHDVVNILFPMNGINVEDSKEFEKTNSETDRSPIIFFILADKEGNRTDYKGLFVRKRGIVTKLLDDGKDMATEMAKDVRTAYFATSNGVYFYNAEENKAEKYGNITDDFIEIAKVNGSDVIYVVNKDHIVYKITEFGTKIEEIREIVNAESIMLDNENNLFYTSGRNVFSFNGYGVKRIDSLPDDHEYMKMIRPPFILPSGMPVVINDKIYLAYVNGTGAETSMKLTEKPTAYSVEASFVYYFGFDKKIYEYNILAGLLNSILDRARQSVRKFLTGGF